MNQIQYVDIDGFLERVSGFQELGAELVALAYESVPEIYHDLEQALQQDDFEASHRNAHSLKGMIEGVGGKVCAVSAERIMHLVKRQEFSTARDQLPQLKHDLRATFVSLQQHFPNVPCSGNQPL